MFVTIAFAGILPAGVLAATIMTQWLFKVARNPSDTVDLPGG